MYFFGRESMVSLDMVQSHSNYSIFSNEWVKSYFLTEGKKENISVHIFSDSCLSAAVSIHFLSPPHFPEIFICTL